MPTHYLLSLILFLLTVACYAQRTEKVYAEYTYIVPENVTLEDSYRIALDRAKTQAIADVFGTVVSQNNTTFITNTNSESKIDFTSIGSSETKGEWIETIGEPKFEKGFGDDGQMWVKCAVEGVIREIVGTKVDLIVKVLRNGVEERFEDTDFLSGDEMYLYFKSPMNGFVAIYLVEETKKSVSCLLPYYSSHDAVQSIEHDKEYIFFSEKTAHPDERSIVDEYVMTCDSDIERNDIYIVFSPNVFAKANSTETNRNLPRQLKWNEFYEWLANNRKKDKDFQVINKQIFIHN